MFKQKVTLFLASSGLLFATACSPKVTQKQSAPVQSSLASYQDTVSYAFGLINGDSFRQSMQGIPGDSLDRVLILAGFSDALLGKGGEMRVDSARTLFQSYVQEIQHKEIEQLKHRNDSILLENKTRPGVQVTASGLQYRILKANEGAKPTVQDTVVVHYSGRTIDGKEFDSSYKRGEPATFGLLQVIPGWTEGVCLMSKGSKYEFYIPAALAYGERGAGGAIPPYSTLIFEVELVDIKPYVEPKSEGNQSKNAIKNRRRK